jgi:hypothetical protein
MKHCTSRVHNARTFSCNAALRALVLQGEGAREEVSRPGYVVVGATAAEGQERVRRRRREAACSDGGGSGTRNTPTVEPLHVTTVHVT